MPEKKTKLTTGEFADRTGLSASTVSQYIRDGKINGEKESGRWMIPESEVGRFKKDQAGGDEPKTSPAAAEAAPVGKKPEKKSASAAGGKAYTVEEFSRLTFLTPSGVLKYLKEGILTGTLGADGQWQVAADNLQSERIRHLIR
ncbi:MAG: helix-turn-helix domain-containing protein [Desulfobacterales bacterium]|nr:helix-turn-helix domain-containing protein [Desulfobacterales bacterium]